jgi:hypothetical protein
MPSGGKSGATGGTSAASSGGATGGKSSGTGGTTLSTTGVTGGVGGAVGSGGKSTGTSKGGSGNGGSNTGLGTGGATAQTGGAATGGVTSSGGNVAGGSKATGGVASSGGTGTTTVECAAAAAVITYPTLPGAVQSPLYTVTANGASQFVEKLTKFSPEMQVHYAYFSVASGCSATVSVTVKESFSSYTLSPKSKTISATKSGNTVTFSSGPNYLILQVDSKELLFILIDAEESNPPHVGDANVKNLADYDVDDTGATLVTSKIQSAIDAASGATQNILYVPPGKYKVGELWLKSNMTLYLAGGAILSGSTSTGDYSGSGGLAVENTLHGVVHMNKISNTKILGRGVIDGNGAVIRGNSNDTPSFKLNVVKIDQSSDILIDGILVRDPVFWNTNIFKSDKVTIQNYKVINRRPTTTTYNQTDGVDYDGSTNGNLYNAFLYTGDDGVSTKTEEDGIDTKNIVHEKLVIYNNSAACKIGTKTFGKTMDAVVFKDIDIVKAGRAMVIDANDTAVIQNTKFENIRVEGADSSLIDIEEDRAPDWRTAPNTAIVRDVYFTNVASNVKKVINIHGKSSTVNVSGVHFSAFTVQGKAVTSQSDPDALWDINQYVSNFTFQ